MTFSDDFAWSLSASNTSSAVHLLRGVWPEAHWVTTCQTTDAAGVDLLGERDGRQPIRIDAKFRRVTQERKRWFDATDPDAVFDLDYKSSDGERRLGPVRRYDGNRTLAPCDFYLYAYPDETPPVGLLVAAQAAHYWLSYSYEGLKVLTSTTTRDDGLSWRTSFVACPASLLNACAATNAARVLTVTNGGVVITLP
jgi:hypothetical protein